MLAEGFQSNLLKTAFRAALLLCWAGLDTGRQANAPEYFLSLNIS